MLASIKRYLNKMYRTLLHYNMRSHYVYVMTYHNVVYLMDVLITLRENILKQHFLNILIMLFVFVCNVILFGLLQIG